MGNTEGILKELSTDRENGEVYEDWMMAPGDLCGTNVTVFSASHPPSSRKRPYIEHALQASKVYRHPGLLKYLDGGIVGGEIVIVTESATPLYKFDLKYMPALQVIAGLAAIMDTLIFLHDRAGVSHNNVNSSAIFITSDGLWKLWALDYSCSFGELSRDHIEHINNYCSDFSIPPDDKTTISPAYQHARDCYAFAKLVESILTPHIASELPFASEFLSLVKIGAMHSDWSKRLRLITLADHNFFRHDFLQLHHDLVNVLLLQETRRDTFLKSLATNLQQYPEELVASTMSGSLLNHTLLLIPTAASHLMPAVLTPKNKLDESNCGLFSEELYKRYILPPLLQLFNILDVTVRSILLAHLPSYITLIPTDILQKQVLPELLLGIKDSSDILVEGTLHGLAHLVPILGRDVVIGSNRHHLFADAKPKAITMENSTFKSTYKLHKKESLLLYKDTLTKEEENCLEDLDSNSLDNLQLGNLSISQIPERSSPDGEDEASILQSSASQEPNKQDDCDGWSDWEELPELQTPKLYSSTTENPHNHTKANRSKTSQGFGEEYDIMAIQVKKRRDSELDLFADIMPDLAPKKFDLESMLQDANSKSNLERVPSVSATLAGLDSEVGHEGDGWSGEDDWEVQDVFVPINDYLKETNIRISELEDKSDSEII